MTLTERVSNSPSGEYRVDTITCLYNGGQSSTKVGNVIGFIRNRGGGTAQVHRDKYLRFVLWWDEATPDHGLYDKDANDGQQYQLCDTDGDDRGYW